jgi:hypothetical protein
MHPRQRVFTLSLGLALGCGDAVDGAVTPGELGDGHFRYVCAGNSDPYCADGSTASSFPQAIAVGGRFSLRYEPRGGGPLPVVEPGSRSAASKHLDVFTLHEPGYVAVFAQDAFGDVIDLLHLNSRRVARMTLSRGGMEQSNLRFAVGETIDVAAEPRDDYSTLLAGSLEYVWVSSDPSVFVVATDTDDDDVTLQAIAPGDAFLHVEAGGFELTIPVEVDLDGDPTTTGEIDTEGDSTGDETGTTGEESTGTTDAESTGTTGDTTDDGGEG